MLLVVGHLLLAPTVGLLESGTHRVGDVVGVHHDLPVDVAGRTADRLDQRGRRAQEPLLVRIEDRDQGDLGQVESLAQQVDADEDVELPDPEAPQDLHPLHGVDVGVQVADPDAVLEQVVGQVLGHLLGQRGHQDPLARVGPKPDELHEIVDLPGGGLDHDLRIDQPRRADDLLDDRVRLTPLVGPRGRRDEQPLTDALQELVEHQGPVVPRRRQPEPVLDQVVLAGAVPLVHATDLRHGHMRLVEEHHEVVGEVVQQGVGRLPGRATVEVPRVVLDAVAAADLADHLEIVVGAHLQPLRFQQLALGLEGGQAIGELGLDGGQRPFERLLRRHVVGRREDQRRGHRSADLTGQGIHADDALHLVTEELDAQRPLVVSGEDLKRVPADPEGPAHQREVVAAVLQRDELAHRGVEAHLGAGLEHEHVVGVLVR